MSESSSIALSSSRIRLDTTNQAVLAAMFDREFLRSTRWPTSAPRHRVLRCADLFSGPGFMSLGVWEACRALGLGFEPVFAVDNWSAAEEEFNANFGAVCEARDVSELLDGDLGSRLTSSEKSLKQRLGKIDLAVGGPPCQGHSSLNNYTRRKDPRNRLYDRMARFAEVARPTHIIIENVSDVTRDRSRVVRRTAQALRSIGFRVAEATIDLSKYGVPQRRRRHFLVASRSLGFDFSALRAYEQPPRAAAWAIGDLLNVGNGRNLDSAGTISEENRKRIRYLFRRDCYDLPNEMRPDCHKFNEHSYNSVYGRMHWRRPAQTVTSGFTSMGQGRYVHPLRKRMITPREAARLQFIPDFYEFSRFRGRSALSQMIANAVPPKIAYVITLELLCQQIISERRLE